MKRVNWMKIFNNNEKNFLFCFVYNPVMKTEKNTHAYLKFKRAKIFSSSPGFARNNNQSLETEVK